MALTLKSVLVVPDRRTLRITVGYDASANGLRTTARAFPVESVDQRSEGLMVWNKRHDRLESQRCTCLVQYLSPLFAKCIDVDAVILITLLDQFLLGPSPSLAADHIKRGSPMGNSVVGSGPGLTHHNSEAGLYGNFLIRQLEFC